MLLIAIVAISTVSVVSAAVDSVDSKDKVYSIESKEKSAANKITWNANGGKIGTKNTITTTINKGSKIGKLQKATRSGYTLKGWYTKKTGGTKISVNTKPTKSVTYYAQWTKQQKKTQLNTYERQLLGSYTWVNDGIMTDSRVSNEEQRGPGDIETIDKAPATTTSRFKFNADGTYTFTTKTVSSLSKFNSGQTEIGRWSANIGTIKVTNRISNVTRGSGNNELNKKLKNSELYYSMKTQNGKKGIMIFNIFHKKD